MVEQHDPVFDEVDENTIFYPKDSAVAISGGNIVPINPDAKLSAQDVVERIKELVCTTYKGEDVRKHGMTLLDAAILSAGERAADGDLVALEKILNRILGKPIQQVATLQVSGTLGDFLSGLHKDIEQGVDPLGE